jgi:hypothetical protein
MPVLTAGTAAAQQDADPISGIESSAHISDGSVEAETTFDLRDFDQPVVLELRLALPEDARVTSVKNAFGESLSYEEDGEKVNFEVDTSSGGSENVRIEYVVEDGVVAKYGDLTIVEMDFAGYGGDTTAEITADETILSASHPSGFSSTMTKRGVVYEGEGSATARVAVGDEGEYDRYAVFGGEDINLSEADNLYSIIPRAFGFEASAYKHPVVFLSDQEYDQAADGWSDGQHRPSGVIMLRRSVDDVTETVLHETAHAYNAEALSWTNSNPRWFEEGTATYVQFLADRTRGKARPLLFASDRTDMDRETDGLYSELNVEVGQKRFGTAEQLLGYYDGTEFMRTWSPSAGSGDRNRFGYIFSELVVRSYVEENGATALHETYDNLRDLSRRDVAQQEPTDVVLDAMNARDDVLRPCATGSRNETIECLNRINTMDATIPEYDGIDSETYPYTESAAIEEDMGDESIDGGDSGDDGTGGENERGGSSGGDRASEEGDNGDEIGGDADGGGSDQMESSGGDSTEGGQGLPGFTVVTAVLAVLIVIVADVRRSE